MTLKVAVDEAKASGGAVAKRKKANPLVSLKSAAKAILDEMEVELSSTEDKVEYVSISMKSLNKLAKAVKS